MQVPYKRSRHRYYIRGVSIASRKYYWRALAVEHSVISGMAAWVPQLAPLHICKDGVRVKLSVGRAVADRVAGEDAYAGVVYTAEPLRVGEVWRITVLHTASKWSRGLVSVWRVCIFCIGP